MWQNALGWQQSKSARQLVIANNRRQICVLPAPSLCVCGVGKLLALSSPHLMWTKLRVETERWLIPSTQRVIPSWVAPPLSLSASLLSPLTIPSPHLSYLILWAITGTHGMAYKKPESFGQYQHLLPPTRLPLDTKEFALSSTTGILQVISFSVSWVCWNHSGFFFPVYFLLIFRS